MTFRQHLRANQDPRAAAMHFRQLLFQRAFAAGGIAVDTRNGDTGEQRRERLFKLFGAQPTGTGAWNRKKGTGAAPDADCRNGGSANAVAPDAACSSDRNVGIRLSNHSRGTVAQAQNPGG